MAEKVSPKAFKINARPDQIVDIPAASNRFDFYDLLEHLHGAGKIDSDTFNKTYDGLQDIEDRISDPNETMRAQNVLFSKALSGANIKALRYMNKFDAGPTWKDMEEGKMTSHVTPDHSYIVTDPSAIQQQTIGRATGGRVGYADGGSPLGLYSKAAQIIRNQPQAKGNVDQLLAMVSKAKGVKPTELANAGRPAGDTMTKEELAQHFEQALPDVQVMRKGRVARNAVNALMQQDRRNWGQEDWDRANALNQEAERQPSSRYDQYTLPGGTNYREHLLHLPEGQGPLAKRRKELQDQWQQAYENQAPREELDRLGAEFDDLANDEGSDFKSSHWRTPNVLAHVRMDEHDNGKTLHVQEVQSDWGQEGRENGFHDPENPFEVIHKKTKEVVSRHPDYRSMTDAWRDHPDRENLDYGDVGDEKPPQGPYVGNTQQWTDLALKHVLTEAAKGGHDRVVFSPGEANADLYGQRKEVQMLKFLKSKDSGEAGILSAYSKDGRRSSEHDIENNAVLAKLLGKENAANLLAQPQNPAPEEGDNLYAHRLQGPLQVGGQGMIDYYKNYVHPGALKLLQQHDPSIKPESYDLPQGYKGFSLPMTDTARQSILKNGFQAFQRGGEVHKATGGPVMGYVPFAPIQIRRLATAPIAPQQSQQSVGRFSQSLGSLMDTVEGFKKKPEETAAAPVATPSPTTESKAPEQPAYDTTGMSDAASSAYGKLTDAWGQPIGVVSAFRDPEKNQSVGGAEGSQHLHGNAYDIDTSDYSYEDRLRLADAAKAAGFTGFGFYGNNMHLDVGPQRAWGPSYHSDSIPDWARPWVNTNVYAEHPRATGGRIGKDDGGAMGQGNDLQRQRVKELIDKHGGDDQAAKDYLKSSISSIPASSQDFWQRTLDNFEYLKAPKPVYQAPPQVLEENSKISNPEYSTGHTAPHPEGGAMMHDPHAVFPDIETHGRQCYGTGADYDYESLSQISHARGRPEASVHIYRAVHKDVKDQQMNAGDWVTTSPSYAKEHGEANLGNKYKILKKTVRADELATNGDSIHEWGYWPKTEKAGGGLISKALSVTRGFTKDGKSAIGSLKPKGK